jgi:hypothetical protein
MAVATVAVDSLATKILPAKVVYNKLKYEDSQDIHRTTSNPSFSDFGPITPLLGSFSPSLEDLLFGVYLSQIVSRFLPSI